MAEPEFREFFAKSHYRQWLDWVNGNAASNSSARLLNEWMSSEDQKIREVISEYRRTQPDNEQIQLLDIGCGFGRHIQRLLLQQEAITAVGIDRDALSIAEARREAVRCGVESRARFLVGDISKLSDVKLHRFEVAICMTNTLGNLEPAKQSGLARGLNEVLQPRGIALFSVYSISSIEARIESYESIGLRVDARGDRLVTVEGLVSQAFRSSELRNLIEGSGLRILGEIENLGEIGLTAAATREP